MAKADEFSAAMNRHLTPPGCLEGHLIIILINNNNNNNNNININTNNNINNNNSNHSNDQSSPSLFFRGSYST